MKAEAERAGAEGGRRVADDKLAELTGSYDRLLVAGLQAQPPPEAPEHVKRQARNLLLRMERRKGEVLLFLTDSTVPFNNNLAERDLRMVKLQQKVGGCFRSAEGARRFCRIRSYLSTMRKHGRDVLGALEGACAGIPLSLRKETSPTTRHVR